MTAPQASKLTSFRFYPALAIFLCAGFLFYKYILQVYPGVITTQLMQTFQLNGTGLGNLAANYFYAYLVAQLFVGIILDKYSPRYLSTLAILACAIGALLFSRTSSLGEAQFARILMGLGSAFATVCYLKNTAIWFKPERFAFVSGLLATAAMLGAIFGETPLAILVHHTGWRNMMFDVGVAGVILAGLFFLIVRDKNPRSVSAGETKYGVSFKDFLKVLSSKQNWLLTLYSGLSFTPIAVFGGLWGNPFLVAAHHLTTTQAATAISASFFGLAVGAPILGLLSDRLGKRRLVMFLGTFLAFFTISVVVYLPSISFAGLLGLLFLFGFGIGAFMLCFAVGTRINPLAMAATVIAMINSGDSILGSFTEPMMGKILDLHWTGVIENGVHVFSASNYRLAMGLLPLYLLISVILLKWIKDHD